ncbi:MAG: fused MFS/spermidine synthase, partial [Verrucomicrobiota bacterium]
MVTHSKYHPHIRWASGLWDVLPAAPFFNPAPYNPKEQATRWAMIGAAAGTGPRLIQNLYGPVRIDGVEIDPVVVEAGRRFFEMDMENFHVDVKDGRSWMNQTTNRYDVILVDAYQQPYIPFELTTREFFQTAHDRLNPTGVIAINVARPTGDYRLVNALATTIDDVFAGVFLLHLPEKNKTTLIVGTNRPATLDDFKANTAEVDVSLKFLVAITRDLVTDHYDPSIVLTDDRAPVERLMDLMIARFIQDLDS